MAQGIARPDINKALESGGNLDILAEEAVRQRQLAERALLEAQAQGLHMLFVTESESAPNRGFEIR